VKCPPIEWPRDRLDGTWWWDASGYSRAGVQLTGCAGSHGIYVVTGIPGASRPIEIPGAELVRQLVLDNQLMLGSVNAHAAIFRWARTI